MLHVHKDDVPQAGIGGDVLKGGELVTKMVYGKSASLMFAERPEDYHSTPHVHDSEQLNYLLKGKIWVFLEDNVMLMEPGDFSRIPEMAVHWSKVKEGPCTTIEAHTPPYVGDPTLTGEDHERVVGLFSDVEEPVPLEESSNVWAAESYADHEEELMRQYRDEHDP